MKRANRQLATARNPPNPIFAAGTDGVAAHGKPPVGPSSSHGLAVSLCWDNHHAAMPAMAARNRTTGVTALLLGGPRDSGLVLGEKILCGARHAVVIGPAVHDRQFLAPISVPRRRFRRLPFQRRRSPRIGAGKRALGQTPY